MMPASSVWGSCGRGCVAEQGFGLRGSVDITEVEAGYANLRAHQLGTWSARGRDSLFRRVLAVCDALAALTATAALALNDSTFAAAAWSVAFVPVWILLAKAYGLYDRDHRSLRHLTSDEIGPLALWTLSGTAALSVFLHVSPAEPLAPLVVVELLLVVGVAAFVFRSSARYIWRRVTPPDRAVILGSGPLADATRRKLELFPDIHVNIRGGKAELSAEETFAGRLAGVDRVIVASQVVDERQLAELLRACRRDGVKLSVVPPLRGMFGTAVLLNHVADLPVVEYSTWDLPRSTLLLKRVLDVIAAGLALVLLSPMLLLIALAIRLTSKGSAIFGQQRAGLNGRPFRMLKFRTMVDGAEHRLDEVVTIDELAEPVFKIRDDPRVTQIGRVLRRFSLDELPQLVNVLQGEMSLVGPRPEQIDLVERYDDTQRVRLEAKPGITGPMQVYGRGELTLEERVAVEREYVENLSISRDLRILALTFAAVFTGRGAY